MTNSTRPSEDDLTLLDEVWSIPGLSLALSGGGFRAAAYGMGVLLYLVQSKLHKHLMLISSVSGGSFANAFIGQRVDIRRLSALEDFVPVCKELLRVIAVGGLETHWAFRAFLVLFVVSLSLPVIAWLHLASDPMRATELLLVVFAVFIPIALYILGRGWVLDRWLRAVLSGPSVRTLKDLSQNSSVRHIFYATDLLGAQPVEFGAVHDGIVHAPALGVVEVPNEPLWRIVRASASYLPLIPPIVLRLPPNEKQPGSKPEVLLLADGGIWNNLATEWMSPSSNPDRRLQIGAIGPIPVSKGEPGGLCVLADASGYAMPWNDPIGLSALFRRVFALPRALDVTYTASLVGRTEDLDSQLIDALAHRLEQSPKDVLMQPTDRHLVLLLRLRNAAAAQSGPLRARLAAWLYENRTSSDSVKEIFSDMLKRADPFGEQVASGRLQTFRVHATLPSNRLTVPSDALWSESTTRDAWWARHSNFRVGTTLFSLGKETALETVKLGYIHAWTRMSVVFQYRETVPLLSDDFFDSLV